MKFQVHISEAGMDYSQKEFWTLEVLYSQRGALALVAKNAQRDLDEVEQAIREEEKRVAARAAKAA